MNLRKDHFHVGEGEGGSGGVGEGGRHARNHAPASPPAPPPPPLSPTPPPSILPNHVSNHCVSPPWPGVAAAGPKTRHPSDPWLAPEGA